MAIEATTTQENQNMAVIARQYFGLIWHWAWLIGLAAVLAGVIAFLVSKQITPVYQTESKVLVAGGSSNSSQSEYSAVLMSERLASTYADMMTTEAVLNEVIKRLNLKIQADKLAEDITITPIRNTQLIQVTVEGTNPIEIAQIANTVITVFSEQVKTLETSRFSATTESLQAQISQTETQIKDLNQRKATAILETSLNAADRTKLTDQKSRLESQLQVLHGQPATAMSENEISTLEAQISTLESEIANLSIQLTNNSNLIASLETQITQYRQIDATLLTNYNEARLTEAQNVSNVVQLSQATPPLTPIRPRPLINTLLAAVLAMMAAIGIILGIDFLDDTIKTPEEVVKSFGISVVGVIFRHEELAGEGVITQLQPRSPISEAFRTLRTNVQYANVDTPMRKIMVTSSSPGEGKSTISANLAVVLAQGGNKVVLIDGDLRRPTLHKRLAVENYNGLTHLIIQPQIVLDGHLKETKTDGLAVLPSGDLPPNPSEILGSHKMKDTIEEIKKASDVVVIDTPPVLAVADAAVLASEMDGVLLVVRPGVTTFSAAKQALEQLQRVGAHLIGVVMNNVDLKGTRYNYYYRSSYYYHNNKYYDTESKQDRRGGG